MQNSNEPVFLLTENKVLSAGEQLKVWL